jgi:hypothetical protein
MRAFLAPGTVNVNTTDKEFELLRARILVARDLVKKIGLPNIPKSVEGQIVELELLWEKPDTRTILEEQVIFSFDHLIHTNC